MGGFFHGWRRKAGMLVLVMAIMFMIGWVRSQDFYDLIVIPVTSNIALQVESSSGQIVCRMVEEGPNRFFWVAESLSKLRLDLKTELDSGPDCGLIAATIEWQLNVRGIPYWSLVVPLGFISLWLLFKMPRKANQVKSGESAAIEGG